MKHKLLTIIVVVIVAIYLMAASTILSTGRDDVLCESVVVEVADSVDYMFVSHSDVEHVLRKKKLWPEGCELGSVATGKIEEVLDKGVFIRDAQCYKTPSGRVYIEIHQRVPVLRVMGRDNYYIDSERVKLPANGQAAYVPVVTGSFDDAFALGPLADIGLFLSGSSFWSAQIEQIVVERDRRLTLIPRVGDHKILFGRPEDISEKFDRLEAFYRNGLSKAGWNKYKTVSVEFDKQIICTKKK